MGFSLYNFLDWKMASVEASKLSKAEHDELCCSYAALMLHDDGLEITAEKITAIIKASKNEVEPYWPMLFAKALKGQNVGELLSNLASAGPAAVVEEEAPKEEKKEE